MKGDDGPILQVILARKKKVEFDVNVEQDTFIEAHDTIRRIRVSFMFMKCHLLLIPSW